VSYEWNPRGAAQVIIILNDDPVYVSWLRRHRSGFVLDTRRKATARNTMLHRASCAQIRKPTTKRTHWTTGGRMKACSEVRDELTEWASEQIGRVPNSCRLCDPTGDDSPAAKASGHGPAERPLTKLENDIVSAVVESAVIHLDNNLEHQMTVADVARYLSKTPGQISAALQRLHSAQILELEQDLTSGDSLTPTLRVLPTAKSLRSVPAFATISADKLQDELAALRGRVD
jgi:hypothetical protein